jgi:hypothetical protein
MAVLSKNFKIWFRGLLAAAISAFSTAASGALTLPTVFNFSHDGLINILKLSIVPAALAVFAYLQKSPIPAPDTMTIDKREIKPDGTETSTSATITTSPENGQVK